MATHKRIFGWIGEQAPRTRETEDVARIDCNTFAEQMMRLYGTRAGRRVSALAA